MSPGKSCPVLDDLSSKRYEMNMPTKKENIRPNYLGILPDGAPHKRGDEPMSLLEAINHKKVKIGFRKFLESEFSVESLDFWLAVEEYKAITDENLRETMAQEIYEEYVSNGSPRQVNLDLHKRQQIMRGTLTSSTFDAAQRYIFNIMENESYARFVQSNCYMICLHSGRRSPLKFLQDIFHNTSTSSSPDGRVQKRKLNRIAAR